MAEIGDLKVKLSLDNAQFDRSVKSMNITLKAMGQEIRGLQNKGKEWGSSIDGLKQKQDAYSRLLEGQQTKVRKLAEAYEKTKAEQGEHADKTQKLAEQLNRATAEMTRTETELNAISAELKRQEAELAKSQSSWNKFGEAAMQAGEKMKAVGDKMKSIGQELSMKVTAPLVGVGALAAKVGSDFEAGMSKVAAISGATGGDLAALEAKAREMGATTQFSASEAADALGYMAMAGWKTNDMLAGIGGVMNLAAASGEDLAMVSDIVTDALTAFGMTANDTGKFVDILAAASSNSNTNVAMLGESFKYAAPVVGALKMNAGDAALALGLMANAGIKGSNSGTALRTMLTNLAAPSKDMNKAMNDLGISLTDSDGKMKNLRQVMDDLRGAFGELEPAQQASYAATIFGKEAMSGALAIINASDADYKKLASSIDGSAGSAENMAKVMNDNLQGRIKEMKSALEEAAISIFKALQPALESLVAMIQKVADWFNTLSPEMMRTIVVIGGIVAAIGPLLVIGGTLISSLGAIFTAFGTVSSAIAVVTTGAAAATPAIGALASVFTVLTGPIGIAVAALAGLTIGTIAFAKNMSESALPSVERFGEGVSESTKKALDGFFDLSENASQSVTEMYVSSTKVTAEMANELTSKYDQMNTQIVDGMKKRNADQLSDMQKFFMDSSALSSEEEQKIIADTQKRHEREITEQKSMNEEIKEITQKAAEEKRELTELEYKTIDILNRSMKENAVRTFSENELEQKVILERMKENASVISAEQAAEVVKNAVKQKDEVIKEANETYEKRMAQIIQMRDETGAISAEQADKMIAEATKAKDQTIFLAEEQHQKIVEKAQQQADEHVDKVNWETGEILSKWEVFKNKHSDIFNKVEETYKKVTDSLKEITSTAYEFIKKTIDEKLGSVVDFVKEQLDKLKEFWDENGQEIFAIVKEQFNHIKSTIEMVMGLIKGIFEIVWPIISGIVKYSWESIKFTVGTALDIILGVIKTMMKLMHGDWEGAWESIKETAEKIWNNIKTFFENVSLVDIGKDIVQGLINGMGTMIEAVGKKAKELGQKVIDKVAGVLQRKSPSRVMIAIGKDVGEGLAIGIESKNERVGEVAKDLGKNLIDIANNYKSEEKKITDKANAEIAQIEKRSKEDIDKINRTAASKKRKTTQDENIKIQRIKEDAAKKIADIEKKSAKESSDLLGKIQKDKLEKIKLFIQDKKSSEELSLEEEAEIWKRAVSQFKEGTKERVEAQKSYNKAVEDLNKAGLENIKQYISDKKSSEELSLVEEAKIWERTIDLFEVGSKERIEAQQNYKKAVEAVNKEIVSINKDFQGQMKTIMDDLAKEEEQRNKAYQDTFDKRKSTLMSFAGTFDEFKVELNRTSAELMGNLQSQVDGFKEWQDQFTKLSERNIDAELLKEISDLGVKALPELSALNSMTDDQLTKYSELYREKSQLAREQTEKELVGMREDTDIQIQKLREAANEKLNLIQKEWDKAIRNLTRTTANELSTLQSIGVDAGQGLLNGLASMQGPLVDKATEIANSIKEAMQGALDIHSPSRVMKGFGVNIAEGLIQGMNSMIAQVEQSSSGLAHAVVGGQNNYDYSKQFSPNVKIYTQDSGSREMERTLRRMAFGF